MNSVEKKMGFEGKNMSVNPPAKVSLKRAKARLETVNKLLEKKFKLGHKRHDEFMRIKNRLEMQIRLMEGDY